MPGTKKNVMSQAKTVTALLNGTARQLRWHTLTASKPRKITAVMREMGEGHAFP